VRRHREMTVHNDSKSRAVSTVVMDNEIIECVCMCVCVCVCVCVRRTITSEVNDLLTIMFGTIIHFILFTSKFKVRGGKCSKVVGATSRDGFLVT